MTGWNGGAWRPNSHYGGGGATDIRINGTSLDDRVLVSGGGGSGNWNNPGGAGGGLVGGDLLEIEANLGINSKVLLTTSSAQKVYGSVGRSKINPEGTFSSQKTKISILNNLK